MTFPGVTKHLSEKIEHLSGQHVSSNGYTCTLVWKQKHIVQKPNCHWVNKAPVSTYQMLTYIICPNVLFFLQILGKRNLFQILG